MLKIRYLLIALTMLLLSQTATADVRVSIGINLPVYPQLVVVPGYPVYYAPNLQANFFFYDGMYWIYQDDAWFVSSWYNGPWSFVEPEYVPVFVLRIPVRYYRQPPLYFYGWRRDAPPRWGDHWGRDWEQRRGSWDKWNRHATPAPAPLPVYQKKYSGDRYPHEVEQQHELQQQKYSYRPRDPVVQEHAVKEHSQQQGEPRAPGQQREFQQDKPRESEERAYKQQEIERANPRPQEPRQQDEQAYPRSQRQGSQQQGSQPQDRGGEDRQRSAPSAPQQQRPEMQDRGQQPQPGMQREQQMPRSQGQQERQQGRDAGREQRQGQGQERGRDRN